MQAPDQPAEPVRSAPAAAPRSVTSADATIRRITLRIIHVEPRWSMRYTNGVVEPERIPLVVVEISNGSVSGFGEFLPLTLARPANHPGAPLIDEWAQLQSFCQNLLGKDARLLRALVPPAMDEYHFNPLVDGVDFAMHDLVGKLAGLPVWSLIGGCEQHWVWAMAVVHTDTPDNMAQRARCYFDMGGHHWFKLKPNGNAEADMETMAKIRERTRPDVRFFMDANYGLKMDPDAVVRYINALAPHGLAVYEDPVDVDLPTYRWIQDRINVRLMLDARAKTPAAVLEVVKHRAAQAINIHADWASGFAPALTKARIARLGGMETLIGSTFYCGFGSAAYQILAAAIPGWHLCEQTNAAEDVKRIAVKREYPTVDGRIHLSDAAGLGVEVDHHALESMTIQQVTIQ